MKVSTLLWFCMLALLSPAQTLKTYESADGTFHFKYSRILIDCSPLLTQGRSRFIGHGRLHEPGVGV